jgi:hypothetical protein
MVSQLHAPHRSASRPLLCRWRCGELILPRRGVRQAAIGAAAKCRGASMRYVLSILAVSLLAACGAHVPQPLLTETAQPVCSDAGPASGLYRGMSPQDVAARLGEPARKAPFRYGDLPAETWYYSADSLNDYAELANGTLLSWRFQHCGVEHG